MKNRSVEKGIKNEEKPTVQELDSRQTDGVLYSRYKGALKIDRRKKNKI